MKNNEESKASQPATTKVVPLIHMKRRKSSSAEFMSHMQPRVNHSLESDKEASTSTGTTTKDTKDSVAEKQALHKSSCFCCTCKNNNNQLKGIKGDCLVLVARCCLRFSGAGLRRAYRLAIMVAICFLTVSAPIISMINDNAATETTSVSIPSSQNNTRIKFIDCTVAFSVREDLSQKEGLQYHANIGGSGGIDNADRCSLTYKNAVPVFSNCQIVGSMPSNLTLPPQTIEIRSTLKRPSTLTFVHNTSQQNFDLKLSRLIVESNYAQINLRGVQVEKNGVLNIHVSNGDVSVADVLLRDNAHLETISDAGNVLVLLRSPALLVYGQMESQFCLSAPKIVEIARDCRNSTDNTSSSASTNTNTSSSSMGCSGTAIMRSDNVSVQEWKDHDQLPTVNASSVDGSLYVAMLPPGPVHFHSKKNANATKFNVVRGSGMLTKNNRLSTHARRYISDIGRKASNDPSQIIFAVFDSGQMIGTSPRISKRLVYASRETFLGIEPWMLSIFSGTMLGPKVVNVPLRWNVSQTFGQSSLFFVLCSLY